MPWDQILVYVIVAGAVLYLAWSSFASRKTAGCGGCARCPGVPAEPPKPRGDLVQIEPGPTRRPPDQGPE
jgi:hypothetical protein